MKFSLGVSKPRLPFDLPNSGTRTFFIVQKDALEGTDKRLEDHHSSVPAQQNPLTVISINIMQISAVRNENKLAMSTGDQELAFD